MIEVKRLSKKYGSFEAVKGVDFSVDTGEIVGLLGPNGAGKTTIMKILTGYMSPTDGSAALNGIDVEENPIAVKASVGYLPENTPLYPELTVAEQLSFIAEAHGLAGETKEERIVTVVKECGLEKVFLRPISELSKGYKQRVGLAQALVHDPDILILDEPTSGLDPNQIIEIRDLIKRLGKEKTVILSTHILQEVEAICSQVLILNDGFIVAKGTAAEIARELHGDEILVLGVKGDDPEKVAAALSDCAAVDKILSARTESPGRVTVRAAVKKGGAAPEEQVFDWAVATGHKLLAIIPQRLSLEQIFTTLTREGTANDK